MLIRFQAAAARTFPLIAPVSHWPCGRALYYSRSAIQRRFGTRALSVRCKLYWTDGRAKFPESRTTEARISKHCTMWSARPPLGLYAIASAHPGRRTPNTRCVRALKQKALVLGHRHDGAHEKARSGFLRRTECPPRFRLRGLEGIRKAGVRRIAAPYGRSRKRDFRVPQVGSLQRELAIDTLRRAGLFHFRPRGPFQLLRYGRTALSSVTSSARSRAREIST